MVTIESLLLSNIYTFCYLSLIVLYTFMGFAKCMSLQYHTKYCHCSENPLHSTYSSSPSWPLNLWKPLIILFFSFAFPKSHAIWRLGIIYHAVFPHWLLPLRNMHLSFLHVSSWLDESFLFSPEFWHILYNHGAIITIKIGNIPIIYKSCLILFLKINRPRLWFWEVWSLLKNWMKIFRIPKLPHTQPQFAPLLAFPFSIGHSFSQLLSQYWRDIIN